MSPSAAWISISGRVITVTSTDTALHNTSTSFTVTSTIDDTGPTNNNSYTFTITLSNPCKTATLNTPSVSTITVADDASNTGTFTDVADSYYTDYGDASFCGTRTFTLTDSGGSSVSWLSVALTSGTTYTITAAPSSTNTELQATHTITLTVASSTYSSDISSVTTTFSVVIATPACTCAQQTWDVGTGTTSTAPVGSTTSVTLPLPSVSASAYTSTPAMRACSASTCSTAGSFTSVLLSSGAALPSWITTANSSTELSIAPTDGTPMASGNWVIAVVYTPTEGTTNPSYTAVTITVTCEITSWSMSAAGTTSFSYDIFDA